MRIITQFERQAVSGGDAIADMPKNALDTIAKVAGAALPYALSPVIGIDRSKVVFNFVIVPASQFVSCTMANLAYEAFSETPPQTSSFWPLTR